MTGPLTGPRGEVRLADGSRVTLRAVEPEDKRLLAAAFDGLSEQSRYRRFFTPLRELDERQLAYLTEVDHHDHEALLAIDARSGNCSGVARCAAGRCRAARARRRRPDAPRAPARGGHRTARVHASWRSTDE